MSLALSFLRPEYDEFDFTRAIVDPRVSVTRSTTGTYFDANGVMQTAPIATPRIDCDPLTGEILGLMMEPPRTNLILDSAAPSTQVVTVTAVNTALSFYGTGSITMSGAYTGTLTGTGAFPNRVEMNFTPTAGALTLTVSGDVQFAQLEAATTNAIGMATSYIPTTSSSASRAIETTPIPSLANVEWNPNAMTLYAEYSRYWTHGEPAMGFAVTASTANGLFGFYSSIRMDVRGASSNTFAVLGSINGGPIKVAVSGDASGVIGSRNGATPVAIAGDFVTGIWPSFTRIQMTTSGSRLRRIRIYPRKLTADELQRITTW